MTDLLAADLTWFDGERVGARDALQALRIGKVYAVSVEKI